MTVYRRRQVAGDVLTTALNARLNAAGPMVAIYAGLRNQAARIAELDAAFLQFVAR